MAVEQKVTFCRICEAHCGMVATVEDGAASPSCGPTPTTRCRSGYACPKGIAMTEVAERPRPRAAPAAARGPTASSSASRWDEALDDIGARLRDVLDEHGPESIGWYMGNPGAFSYSHTLWVKGFLDALGSPHYYTAGSQDVNNRFAASALLYGSPLRGADPRPPAHRLPAHGRAPTRSSRTARC